MKYLVMNKKYKTYLKKIICKDLNHYTDDKTEAKRLNKNEVDDFMSKIKNKEIFEIIEIEEN